jgi:hypothetical protein
MWEYQIQAGQWVSWFRYDTVDSTSHPVYDVGPNRIWYPAMTLPVMIGEYHRAAKNFDDDGLYLIDNVHLICSYDAFFHTTMIDPDPTGQDHLNDRVAFDGHLFHVTGFMPEGRVADYFLTISIDVAEVATEDLAEDPAAAMFLPYLDAS